MIKKKSLLNYCGLLGVAAFLSYTAAVVFSPLAYSGYDWMAQAVSIECTIASVMEPAKQSVCKRSRWFCGDQTIKSRGQNKYRSQLLHGMQNGGIPVLIAE